MAHITRQIVRLKHTVFANPAAEFKGSVRIGERSSFSGFPQRARHILRVWVRVIALTQALTERQ